MRGVPVHGTASLRYCYFATWRCRPHRESADQTEIEDCTMSPASPLHLTKSSHQYIDNRYSSSSFFINLSHSAASHFLLLGNIVQVHFIIVIIIVTDC